ncbi:MAG: L-threonylcarbamoyladenylate synthase, partial [Ferrovibrio sp.]
MVDVTISEAAERLLRGEVVAIPTETVYGLAADATNADAVAKIFAAKGRPDFNPLISHIADHAQLDALVLPDARARKLADAFWPGALTLVMPR